MSGIFPPPPSSYGENTQDLSVRENCQPDPKMTGWLYGGSSEQDDGAWNPVLDHSGSEGEKDGNT